MGFLDIQNPLFLASARFPFPAIQPLEIIPLMKWFRGPAPKPLDFPHTLTPREPLLQSTRHQTIFQPQLTSEDPYFLTLQLLLL